MYATLYRNGKIVNNISFSGHDIVTRWLQIAKICAILMQDQSSAA
jgi:hypothetical protein